MTPSLIQLNFPTGELTRETSLHLQLLARSDELFAAPHMSAFGTKQTSQHGRLMSAFGGIADIDRLFCDQCSLSEHERLQIGAVTGRGF
jgi:hypothetical protein